MKAHQRTTEQIERRSNEIQRFEVDTEYHLLLQAAIAKLSGQNNAKVVGAVLQEARKALSRELINEAKIVNPQGGFTRRYLILEEVRIRLDSDILQVNKQIIPDGVSALVGAAPSHDDARTRNGRIKYRQDE